MNVHTYIYLTLLSVYYYDDRAVGGPGSVLIARNRHLSARRSTRIKFYACSARNHLICYTRRPCAVRNVQNICSTGRSDQRELMKCFRVPRSRTPTHCFSLVAKVHKVHCVASEQYFTRGRISQLTLSSLTRGSGNRSNTIFVTIENENRIDLHTSSSCKEIAYNVAAKKVRYSIIVYAYIFYPLIWILFAKRRE